MPEPFRVVTGIALPLMRDNVDTDAIIPSREIRAVSKTGLADGLFAGWRYLGVGSRTPDPSFPLNQASYVGACILLGGTNFGCGSSREHAVWALAEYGFRAVIAPSFNPIFRGNCVRNGLAPVELPKAIIDDLTEVIASDPRRAVTIDLQQGIVTAQGFQAAFSIGGASREMLLEGLDPIDLTLRGASEILAFRMADRAKRPWAYLATSSDVEGSTPSQAKPPA